MERTTKAWLNMFKKLWFTTFLFTISLLITQNQIVIRYEQNKSFDLYGLILPFAVLFLAQRQSIVVCKLHHKKERKKMKVALLLAYWSWSGFLVLKNMQEEIHQCQHKCVSLSLIHFPLILSLSLWFLLSLSHTPFFLSILSFPPSDSYSHFLLHSFFPLFLSFSLSTFPLLLSLFCDLLSLLFTPFLSFFFYFSPSIFYLFLALSLSLVLFLCLNSSFNSFSFFPSFICFSIYPFIISFFLRSFLLCFLFYLFSFSFSPIISLYSLLFPKSVSILSLCDSAFASNCHVLPSLCFELLSKQKIIP